MDINNDLILSLTLGKGTIAVQVDDLEEQPSFGQLLHALTGMCIALGYPSELIQEEIKEYINETEINNEFDIEAVFTR